MSDTTYARRKTRYLLKWRHGSDIVFVWYLFIIFDEDATTYVGELRRNYSVKKNIKNQKLVGYGKSVEGELLKCDASRISELINNFSNEPLQEGAGWKGLLVDKSRNSGQRIIYRYFPEMKNQDTAKKFLDIVQVIRPYLDEDYRELDSWEGK